MFSFNRTLPHPIVRVSVATRQIPGETISVEYVGAPSVETVWAETENVCAAWLATNVLFDIECDDARYATAEAVAEAAAFVRQNGDSVASVAIARGGGVAVRCHRDDADADAGGGGGEACEDPDITTLIARASAMLVQDTAAAAALSLVADRDAPLGSGHVVHIRDTVGMKYAERDALLIAAANKGAAVATRFHPGSSGSVAEIVLVENNTPPRPVTFSRTRFEVDARAPGQMVKIFTRLPHRVIAIDARLGRDAASVDGALGAIARLAQRRISAVLVLAASSAPRGLVAFRDPDAFERAVARCAACHAESQHENEHESASVSHSASSDPEDSIRDQHRQQ